MNHYSCKVIEIQSALSWDSLDDIEDQIEGPWRNSQIPPSLRSNGQNLLVSCPCNFLKWIIELDRHIPKNGADARDKISFLQRERILSMDVVHWRVFLTHACSPALGVIPNRNVIKETKDCTRCTDVLGNNSEILGKFPFHGSSQEDASVRCGADDLVSSCVGLQQWNVRLHDDSRRNGGGTERSPSHTDETAKTQSRKDTCKGQIHNLIKLFKNQEQFKLCKRRCIKKKKSERRCIDILFITWILTASVVSR